MRLSAGPGRHQAAHAESDGYAPRHKPSRRATLFLPHLSGGRPLAATLVVDEGCENDVPLSVRSGGVGAATASRATATEVSRADWRAPALAKAKTLQFAGLDEYRYRVRTRVSAVRGSFAVSQRPRKFPLCEINLEVERRSDTRDAQPVARESAAQCDAAFAGAPVGGFAASATTQACTRAPTTPARRARCRSCRALTRTRCRRQAGRCRPTSTTRPTRCTAPRTT
jgi:hypothetical protein